LIISTMNDLPGYKIDEVMGEVFGLTVRSRNVGSQVGASLKSLVGGELKGMTRMLAEGREHATDRLIEEAEARARTRSSPSASIPQSWGPPGPRSARTERRCERADPSGLSDKFVLVCRAKGEHGGGRAKPE
jgi:Putative heavy-metal-binding